ncbi:MAG: trehalose utilization protein [Planctomycetaceae bacterium]|nr:trehalose utilization protein [Planctomycetaceae bacterium]
MITLRALCFTILIILCPLAHAAETINVVVWDEQQPAQKEAYANFLGNEIAAYLSKQEGLSVRSVNLASPEKGIADNVLNSCDVLIWWGHIRQFEITPEQGQAIVTRIKNGQLSLIALHSAHWATPFVEAMKDRTKTNAINKFKQLDSEQLDIKYVDPPRRYFAPDRNDPLTPRFYPRKFPSGKTELVIHWPNCCFPAYRNDGKPSTLFTIKKSHPIANGIPAKFQLPSTEMYDEPFHIPAPDEVVFEERWPTGEWFRSGMIWNIGEGKVFYFRPGHETFPVYKQPVALKIVENAVRYLHHRD